MLSPTDTFPRRHNGPGEKQTAAMLAALGYRSLEDLSAAAVPAAIQLGRALDLPAAATESGALHELRGLASRNQVFRSCIGQGYYGTHTPPVILRTILENPGWYTAYTPYQAEISQGRMEALLNFQTLITELTGLDISNASLLDEATAAAEAMSLSLAIAQKGAGKRNLFLVADDCHPQTIEVVRTRAEPLGIEVIVQPAAEMSPDAQVFGLLLQYPGTDGRITDPSALIQKAKEAGALTTVAVDLLALTLLKTPGDLGADIAVGSSQRFGVPMGFGGPHAAFLATRDAHKRLMPGRLIGVSHDSNGKPALRLSLQTREQHIRRDKATSNICTAQVLLAVMASMYAVYHGPEGLKQIALRVRALTATLAEALRRLGFAPAHSVFFDTLRLDLADAAQAESILQRAAAKKINLRRLGGKSISISLDETVTEQVLADLLSCFTPSPSPLAPSLAAEATTSQDNLWTEAGLHRQGSFLAQPVFNRYHTETELLRYIRRLEMKDITLANSMIPLGSCTMKLNAASEMLPVTWPEFCNLHPFAPLDQAAGYLELFQQLEAWLCEITGFAAVSLQPNAGSQGEYAGLLAIHRYHGARGESHRNVCLIPTSAHGTNPASAVMAGMKVVPVACRSNGDIDLDDLQAKAAQHAANLSCLMVTYPSTHGVFEATIRDICKIVHDAGGQVYMDGANMNAQVGLCRPGDIGADVCHLNLHKTFCIPHGGGGPGVGPIGVAKHLAGFLPGYPAPAGSTKQNTPSEAKNLSDFGFRISNFLANGGAVSAAPWGSAGILSISWMYIRMMGPDGLKAATQIAILNANYIAAKVKHAIPLLYTGANGLVAHECILDFRKFKDSAGVEVEDVAKRLMDFGFHAPTMSWPVPGTLMVEPTESESQEELDRFVEALLQIHREIQDIETGKADKANNVLKHAPHVAEILLSDTWDRPYSRQQAAFPLPWVKERKIWPSVGRVDNVYGDRNLVCTCPSVEELAAS
jgi:glycine dehydrogenase